MTLALKASYTNIATGFVVDFRAQNAGPLITTRWEFDEGTVVSNQPYISRSWVVAGDYPCYSAGTAWRFMSQQLFLGLSP